MAVNQGNIQLVVKILTDEAQKNLDSLTAKQQKLQSELDKLTPGTDKFIKKSKELDSVNEKMSALQKQIENGNLPSLKKMEDEQRSLVNQLKRTSEGTKEYEDLEKKIATLGGQITETKAKIGAIGKEVEVSGSKFKEFGGGIKESITSMLPLGAAAAGAFAVQKILEFGKGAVEAFNEAENATFLLRNQMVILGGESEETFQRLMDQADALEASSYGFTAEQIQGAQLQLKQLELTGAEIEKLTPKILDYAAATGKDLKSATDDVTNAMLGKDKALQKVGINLGKSELTIQGVTNALDKFAGTAESQLDVGTNSLERLSDEFGKVEEAIGGFLANGLLTLIDWLRPLGVELGKAWDYLTGLYGIFVDILAPIQAWTASLAESYPQIGQFITWIGKAISPLTFLTTKISDTVTSLKEFTAGTIATVATVETQWERLKQAALDTFGGVGELIKTALTNPLEIGTAYDKLKNTVAKAGADIGTAYADNYNKAIARLSGGAATAASSGGVGAIADRKIKDPDALKAEAAKTVKDVASAEATAQKQADAEAEKVRKEAQDKAKKDRDQFLKDKIEADKQAEALRLAAITDSFEREKAVLASKLQDDLAAIAAKEEAVNANMQISEQERADILATFTQTRKALEAQNATDIAAVNEKMRAEVLAGEKRMADEARKELDETNRYEKARLELRLLFNKDNAKELLAIRIEQVEKERDILLQNEKLTATERELIEAQTQVKIGAIRAEAANAEKNNWVGKFQEIAKYGQQALNNVNELSRAISERQIADAERVKNVRIKKLEDEKKRGLLTEAQYTKQKEAIEKEANDRIRAVKRKQAERDKAAAVIQAAINTSVEVTKVIANPILAAIVAALGAIQIATIAAKPIPEFAKGGFISRGPSHASGGIKLFDPVQRSIVGEIEGNEVVLSADTYRNNRDIIDPLLFSSMTQGGKRAFKDGGFLTSATTTPISNFPSRASGGGGEGIAPLLLALLEEQRATRADINAFNGRLQAVISYQDLMQAIKDIADIKGAAGAQ